MSIERVFPVFSVVFAVAYLSAVEFNWALFTFHPQTGTWGFLVEPARTGPAMYWYGWLATAMIAGVAGASLALVVPEGAAARVPPRLTWVVPLLTIVAFAILLRGFFMR